MLQASLATENGKAESESPLLAEVGFVIGQFRGRVVAGSVVAGSGLGRKWMICSTDVFQLHTIFAGPSRGCLRAGMVS